jgi:hypothetical protein
MEQGRKEVIVVNDNNKKERRAIDIPFHDPRSQHPELELGRDVHNTYIANKSEPPNYVSAPKVKMPLVTPC